MRFWKRGFLGAQWTAPQTGEKLAKDFRRAAKGRYLRELPEWVDGGQGQELWAGPDGDILTENWARRLSAYRTRFVENWGPPSAPPSDPSRQEQWAQQAAQVRESRSGRAEPRSTPQSASRSDPGFQEQWVQQAAQMRESRSCRTEPLIHTQVCISVGSKPPGAVGPAGRANA